MIGRSLIVLAMIASLAVAQTPDQREEAAGAVLMGGVPGGPATWQFRAGPDGQRSGIEGTMITIDDVRAITNRADVIELARPTSGPEHALLDAIDANLADVSRIPTNGTTVAALRGSIIQLQRELADALKLIEMQATNGVSGQ